MKNKVFKTDQEWRSLLGPNRYRICRQSGTEPAFSGDLWDLKDVGTYACACCDGLLFESERKYDSGSGWPSFSLPANEAHFRTARDTSHGMVRTGSPVLFVRFAPRDTSSRMPPPQAGLDTALILLPCISVPKKITPKYSCRRCLLG